MWDSRSIRPGAAPPAREGMQEGARAGRPVGCRGVPIDRPGHEIGPTLEPGRPDVRGGATERAASRYRHGSCSAPLGYPNGESG